MHRMEKMDTETNSQEGIIGNLEGGGFWGGGSQTTDLSVMGKLYTHKLSFIMGDSNNIEGLGFHGVKLSKM